MKDKLGDIVFAVGDRRYDWAHVVLWAQAWGRWAEFEAAVRLGLACSERAAADADADGPDDGALDTALNDFRYARGLLTAEETDAWFERSALSADDWVSSIERTVLAQHWVGDGPKILAAFPVADADVAMAMWPDGVCGGELEAFARELAGRAGLYARLCGEVPHVDRLLDAHVETAVAAALEAIRAAVPIVDTDAEPERLAHVTRLEVAWRRHLAAALTPEALRDRINLRQLEWMRIDCEILSVVDEQAAREAALLVRADGLALAEVAELAGTRSTAASTYLDDAEPALRDRLLSAQRGDLVGPVKLNDEFRLVLVRDKILPTDGDETLRRRADVEVRQRLLSSETDGRVVWVHPALVKPL